MAVLLAINKLSPEHSRTHWAYSNSSTHHQSFQTNLSLHKRPIESLKESLYSEHLKNEKSKLYPLQSSRSGFKGVSLYWFLFPLYGFFPCRDFVIDLMHLLHLGIEKTTYKRVLLGRDHPEKKKQGNVLSTAEIIQLQHAFVKTCSKKLLDVERVPNLTKIRSWNSAEFKFFTSIFPLFIGNRTSPIPIEVIEILQNLEELQRFLLHPSPNLQDIETLLFLCYSFLSSHCSVFGMEFQSINFHRLLHVPSSILFFGTLRYMWTWQFERSLRPLINQIPFTNYKNIEVTLSAYLSLRFFVPTFSDIRKASVLNENNYKQIFNDTARKYGACLYWKDKIPEISHVRSLKNLENFTKEPIFSHFLGDYEEKGIFVGRKVQLLLSEIGFAPHLRIDMTEIKSIVYSFKLLKFPYFLVRSPSRYLGRRPGSIVKLEGEKYSEIKHLYLLQSDSYCEKIFVGQKLNQEGSNHRLFLRAVELQETGHTQDILQVFYSLHRENMFEAITL